MRFKEWCLSNYGITSFTEAKVIDRVFLPAIPENRPILDALMLKFGGYTTTHQQLQGLTFTRQQFEGLLHTLELNFKSLHPDASKEQIIDNATRHFRRLGFNTKSLMQYRTLPGIHVVLNAPQAVQALCQQFSRFHPKLTYNFLIHAYVVEMPANFLNFLYDSYYNNSGIIFSVNDIPYLTKREFRLQQLVDQIKRNNLTSGLNLHQHMALDYDNLHSTTHEICSTYAMSLKIYAELHRDALSSLDYNTLYTASTLLAAYDRHGNLKQSLKSDALFVDYIRKGIYQTYLKSINYDGVLLLDELPQDIHGLILSEINTHTDNLLYGHSKTRVNKNQFIRTQRFMPDEQNHSDTDEIILRGGGQNGHSANFRLIKVAIFLNQDDQANNKPHHYEYFKVENNLGIHCHLPNTKTKTCLGTYVTKITPCIRNDDKEVVQLEIDPYTHPEDYQAAMKKTLKELIKIERLLLFYRDPNIQHNSKCSNKEGDVWLRLNKIRLVLSGHPYNHPVYYCAQDALNPAVKYLCTVSHQVGYIQEGGSCPLFSIKSLVASVIGLELTALHNHFMQQHDAFDYMDALQLKSANYRETINKLSPLFITGDSQEIDIKVTKFKELFSIKDGGPLSGLTILSTPNPHERTVVINNTWLKILWINFINGDVNNQENLIPKTNPNQFFHQKQLPNTSPDAARHELHNPGI